MIKLLLILAGLALVTAASATQPGTVDLREAGAVMPASAAAQNQVCTPGAADPQCELALTGTLLLHAVDETRVLVAIDTHEVNGSGDGHVDHLFLIVGPNLKHRVPEPMQRPEPGAISIPAGAKAIQLSPVGAKPRELSLIDVNWSHFWGYGSKGPLIVRLVDAQPAATCDHTAGSCWQVDGFPLYFPS